MKILVFNVKYSENLGDGLLAQCLEMALRDASPDADVETIDLAGRTGFGATARRRQLAIKVLHWLPAFARRMAVERILRPQLAKLRQKWDLQLAGADAVVIGGGNLFQDDDLNFPLKIGQLLDCVERSGLPLAIHAVGVSATWSQQARRLFGRLLKTNLRMVSVRDEISRKSWERHFPAGPAAALAPDPGLLTRDLAAAMENPDHSPYKGTIAICVTSPIILLRHASMSSSSIPLKTVGEYSHTIRKLVAAGYRVLLFCNGAREDQAFADRIAEGGEMAALLSSGQLRVAPRPTVPEELIRILGSASVVVAHRLHACIAAYSLGIPNLGLGWDAKVSGFFQTIDRSGFYLSGKDAGPERIASLVVKAHEEGLDPLVRATAINGARSSVAAILDALWPRKTSKSDAVRDMNSLRVRDARSVASSEP